MPDYDKFTEAIIEVSLSFIFCPFNHYFLLNPANRFPLGEGRSPLSVSTASKRPTEDRFVCRPNNVGNPDRDPRRDVYPEPIT